MKRKIFAIGIIGLLVMSGIVTMVSLQTTAWSNGGYSSDPSNPDYGTHDWIAQHALDWLPANETQYILDNFATYLYGTELPDNSGASDGIGDTTKHHVYYYLDGVLQDGASAVRAMTEFNNTKVFLENLNYSMAAKNAGIMSHYIADIAVFGHVMGSGTEWGAENHHSDYEDYVTNRMTNYTSSMFDPYLVFDGTLTLVTAYDAALWVAYNTTFGDNVSIKNCTWMDANYDWSDPIFKNSCGASLNRAVNILADVLHTLAVLSGYSGSIESIEPHAPISINGNADFAAQATSEKWTGNGSAENPYIIENYDIDASILPYEAWQGHRGGIHIEYTDVYFVIKNCVVYDGRTNETSGIYFYNVRNGSIDAVISYNNYVGIFLAASSWAFSNNNQITNCTVHHNFYGMGLDWSSGCRIASSNAYENDYGIGIGESRDSIITACKVYNNSYGIVVADALDTNVNYCDIHNNKNYGVCSYVENIISIVNATYNWWGSASGPYHPDTNPTGTGDNVTDNVLYNPWLTEPWTGENQPPVADFTYSPALIVSTTGRIINFMDLSYDPDGNLTAWFWGFGDNNTSTEQNPAHQYLVEDNYTVNLTVTDDDGAINTTSKEITITVLDFGIIINISLTNLTIVNLTCLNISYAVNITNLSIINISYINITNLMNISNVSFANVFEVTLTNFTYMSSSSFINVSYVNITQSMSVNNLMFNNVGYVHLQNVTNVNFVITAILNIITIAYENLQMVIPAEALILSMPFNLSTTSASLPPGYDVVGDMYRIECGVSTGAPISITLSYAGIVLPLGITEYDLAVYKKVGDNWIKIDSIVDKLNSTVSAQVTSFSDYAILYKQPSTEEEEEGKPPTELPGIPWLYIIIPIIIIIVVAGAGLGIRRKKKGVLPPEKPVG